MLVEKVCGKSAVGSLQLEADEMEADVDREATLFVVAVYNLEPLDTPLEVAVVNRLGEK